MDTRLFGIAEAGKQLGMSAGTLRCALLYGKLREFDVANRAPNGARLFTAEDIARLRSVLQPGAAPGEGSNDA